jgi:hypothetical protein
MAREAGIDEPESDWMYWAAMERFAALVRADERKSLMQLFTDLENQPTQHGTVTLEYMKREIEAEREACAKVCEENKNQAMDWIGTSRPGGHFAAAIRARGQT